MSRAAEARWRIRAARPADAGAILALERHFPGDRLSARSLRRLLRSPSAHVCVAQDAGGVIGALVLLTRRTARVARIYSVAVSPAARGRGVGTALTRQAERTARRRGCVRLSLEVRADNAPARGLYRSLGFVETGRLPRYYDDGGEGIRLVRDLSASSADRPSYSG